MLTKYIGDIGDSASLGIQHKKISLVWDKNLEQLSDPIYARILLHVKFVNILKYSYKKIVLHLQNIHLFWNLNSE